MTVAPNKTTKDNNEVIKGKVEQEKKCFTIMPIADHPDYDNGHFSRVYNHLIKPACQKAGFKAVRADDAKASHMIMFDILKNIIECDMAICDLSSKNANVFYELGLRQAFNKKTILITDGRTNTPFDITGFRYVKYDHTLRIDSVINDIDEISAMLLETETASDDDVNSIVKLLKIQPAKIENLQLNEQDTVIFEMIRRLDEKMTRIENSQKHNTQFKNSNLSKKLIDMYSTSCDNYLLNKLISFDPNNIKPEDIEIFIKNRKNDEQSE
ncbi:hypothetical protein FEH47_08240 [Salmonella enterica]|nr:hypothetical protein [Salmonella enterica]